MLVENWINPKVITVDINDSMLDASKLLKEHGIRRLPVLKNGKLVGILTDRDLKRASPSDATSLAAHELLYIIANIKVGEIMTKDPVTIPFNHTVEEAAEILLEKKISGMPVVDKEGDVIGTITQTDIFKVLISVTGVGKGGMQFAFLLEDRSGSIREVADIIRKYGGRMTSILSSYERSPAGHRHAYIRAHGINREKLSELKKELMAAAKLLYVIDHKRNTREIFVS
ncbi:MAG: CBS domain-containing protein [Deltaproteobacteria bacterium]|nr:CBS domain-containing protein [Deltaproteobacteria bacterium]